MPSIIDIHTHREAPYPEGVVSLRVDSNFKSQVSLQSGQCYSAAIHPWDILEDGITEALNQLENITGEPEIVAIGECGIDLVKGGSLYRQLQIFRRHIDLSEASGKPLIIHDVKGDDIICGLRRDLHPSQPWAIHGYRGKPGGAQALIRSGCYLSFGEKYNPETLAYVMATAPERILAETDESQLPITDIISALNVSTDLITENTADFLHHPCIPCY